MTEAQAVEVIEQLSDSLGALENLLLTHNPTLWLRWQQNREPITREWLDKLLEESS